MCPAGVLNGHRAPRCKENGHTCAEHMPWNGLQSRSRGAGEFLEAVRRMAADCKSIASAAFRSQAESASGSIGLCGGSYCRRASSDCDRQPHFSFQLDRFSINQNVGRNCAGLQIQHDWGEQVQTRPAADCKSRATRRLRGAGSAQRFSQITNPAEPHIVSADCKSSETYNLLQLNCRNACSASSRLQSAATTDYSGMVQRW